MMLFLTLYLLEQSLHAKRPAVAEFSQGIVEVRGERSTFFAIHMFGCTSSYSLLYTMASRGSCVGQSACIEKQQDILQRVFEQTSDALPFDFSGIVPSVTTYWVSGNMHKQEDKTKTHGHLRLTLPNTAVRPISRSRNRRNK